jgi:hypothetical protein
MENALIGKTPRERLENEYISKSYREMYLAVRTFHMLADPGSEVSKELEQFMEEIFMETWKDKTIVIKHLQEGMRLIHGIIDKSAKAPPPLPSPSSQEMTTTTTTTPNKVDKGGEGIVNRSEEAKNVTQQSRPVVTVTEERKPTKTFDRFQDLSKHLRGDDRPGIGSKRTQQMRETLGLTEDGAEKESDAR